MPSRVKASTPTTPRSGYSITRWCLPRTNRHRVLVPLCSLLLCRLALACNASTQDSKMVSANGLPAYDLSASSTLSLQLTSRSAGCLILSSYNLFIVFPYPLLGPTICHRLLKTIHNCTQGLNDCIVWLMGLRLLSHRPIKASRL